MKSVLRSAEKKGSVAVSKKSNLVPKKITDKNGIQRTVYVRPDEGPVSDKKISKRLSDKKINKENKAKPPFEGYSSIESCSHALYGNPKKIVDSEFQSKLANTYHNSIAERDAYGDVRKELKGKIISKFTDRQIEKGEIKLSDDGSFAVDVALERERFHPEKAGLSLEEMKECSTSAISNQLIREKFPETYEKMGAPVKGFYYAMQGNFGDSDEDREVQKKRTAYKEELKESLRPKGNQSIGKLISKYIELEDKEAEAEKNINNCKKHIVQALERINRGNPDKIPRTLECPETGTKIKVAQRMKYDTSSFETLRAEHHYNELVNQGYSEDRATRLADRRAIQEWASVQTMKIYADTVKEKYPEKYEKGRPETKVMYISEMD